MKRLVEIVALLCAGSAAAAFDSAAWLAHRDALAREAARLKVAYTNCAARVTEPAEDITVPIETFPDGSVKSSVTAKKAMVFLDTGMVWAADVTVRKVDVDGRVVSQLDAKACVIDRKKKCGWAEGPATLRHGETEFSGEGIFFSSREGFVSVKSKSRIQASDLRFGGIE